MNAISIELPKDLRDKIEAIASERNVPVAELYLDMTRAMIEDYDVERRFRERAERGKGRETEALALLRR